MWTPFQIQLPVNAPRKPAPLAGSPPPIGVIHWSSRLQPDPVPAVVATWKVNQLSLSVTPHLKKVIFFKKKKNQVVQRQKPLSVLALQVHR